MVAAIVLLWLAAVVVLAGLGYKVAWLAALLSFPLLIGIVFALEPSFRGSGSRDYVTMGAVVAGMIWIMASLASTVAWFIGNRKR